MISHFLVGFSIAILVMANEDIQFRGPDLTTPFTMDNRVVHLDAYRVRDQMRWVSVGSPHMIGDYEFTREAILFNVRVLDNDQRQALVQAAQRKHPNAQVSGNDFSIIPLQEFVCTTSIYYDDAYHSIGGRATDFHSTLIEVELRYPETSYRRKMLESRIRRGDRITWTCKLSAAGQVQRTSRVTITSRQMQTVVQEGALFGNGSEIYVTRNQLNEMSHKVRTHLDIEEMYDTYEFDFDQAFINQLISMAPLRNVDIDEALSKLSKLGVHMDGRDISPNEIKREMSNRFMIKTENGKQYIGSGASISQIGTGSGHGYPAIGLSILEAYLDASMKYAEANSAGWKESNKDVTQQLRELNQADQTSIQWQIEGTRIVPKNIKVAKITRAVLSRDFVITWSKTRVTNAQYQRVFTVRTRQKSQNCTGLQSCGLPGANSTTTSPILQQVISSTQSSWSIGVTSTTKAPSTSAAITTSTTMPTMRPTTTTTSITRRKIYVGTSRGNLFVSDDNGETWSRDERVGNSINSICKSNGKLFLGTSHGLLISSNNGQSWKMHPMFNTTGIRNIQLGQSGLYASTYYYDNTLYRSTDVGESWTLIVGVKGQSLAVSGNRIYAAYAKTFYISIDGGSTWINRTISSLNNATYIEHKFMLVSDETIYIYTNLGLHISYDHGTTWCISHDLNNKIRDLKERVFSGFVKNNTVYVGSTDSFFKSLDSGNTWQGPLDCGAIRIFHSMAASAHTIYLRTRAGLYAYEEAGQNSGKCKQLHKRDYDSIMAIFVE